MSGYFYVVPDKGKGTDADPYRPDVPDSISWVGQRSKDGTYLIRTETPLFGEVSKQERKQTELAAECAAREIRVKDALSWRACGPIKSQATGDEGSRCKA